MKVNAKLKNLRISPRKVGVVTKNLLGLRAQEALAGLGTFAKKANLPLKKLIESAVANAENNFGLDRENLKISDIQVGAGTVFKRWMPRAFGRATPIMKRTSNIGIVLEEIEEGKNRKSPHEMSKEKKKRETEKKKFERELGEGHTVTEEEIAKKPKLPAEEKKEHREVEAKEKQSRFKGWSSKIFRRKSM